MTTCLLVCHHTHQLQHLIMTSLLSPPSPSPSSHLPIAVPGPGPPSAAPRSPSLSSTSASCSLLFPHNLTMAQILDEIKVATTNLQHIDQQVRKQERHRYPFGFQFFSPSSHHFLTCCFSRMQLLIAYH